jgi:hypothetical protein
MFCITQKSIQAILESGTSTLLVMESNIGYLIEILEDGLVEKSNNMNKKYYKPSIGEFGIGLEYEYKTKPGLGTWMNKSHGKWTKRVFEAMPYPDGLTERTEVDMLLANGLIRVKKLCIEDLLKEGYKQTDDLAHQFKGPVLLQFGMVSMEEVDYDVLTIFDKYGDNILFDGKIKNIYELRKLVKWLTR